MKPSRKQQKFGTIFIAIINVTSSRIEITWKDRLERLPISGKSTRSKIKTIFIFNSDAV
jgi:hypothetical protein